MPHFDRLYLNIGAMKAGTTWLYRQLEQHPDILFSPEKELHYHACRNGDRRALGLKHRLNRARNAVNRAPGGLLSEASREALDWYVPYVLSPPLSPRWYRRRFPRHPGQGRYCADFSNLTAVIDERGWEGIRGMATNVRLSYVLRHPLERVWSHLKFLRQLGTSLAPPEALTPHDIEALDRRYDLWRHSQYSQTIACLRRHFGPHELKILYYDDIELRPGQMLREIEDFLELPRHDYVADKLGRRINESAALSIPSVVQDVFAERLQRELAALQALGVEPPGSWFRAAPDVSDFRSD